MGDDFENYRLFVPREFHEKALGLVFDQVIALGGALGPLREKRRTISFGYYGEYEVEHA